MSDSNACAKAVNQLQDRFVDDGYDDVPIGCRLLIWRAFIVDFGDESKWRRDALSYFLVKRDVAHWDPKCISHELDSDYYEVMESFGPSVLEPVAEYLLGRGDPTEVAESLDRFQGYDAIEAFCHNEDAMLCVMNSVLTLGDRLVEGDDEIYEELLEDLDDGEDPWTIDEEGDYTSWDCHRWSAKLAEELGRSSHEYWIEWFDVVREVASQSTAEIQARIRALDQKT